HGSSPISGARSPRASASSRSKAAAYRRAWAAVGYSLLPPAPQPRAQDQVITRPCVVNRNRWPSTRQRVMPARLPAAYAGMSGLMDSTAPGRTISTRVPARLDRLPWAGFHWRVVIGRGKAWLLDGLEVTMVGSGAARRTEPGSGSVNGPGGNGGG